MVGSHGVLSESESKPAGPNEHGQIEGETHQGGDTGREDLPWERIQAMALRQLDRLMAMEPKVLRGENAEAIHDMRIATRRLQQLMDLMFAAPQPREVARMCKRVRRCRRVLSEVRNCDVLLQHAKGALAAKKPTHRVAWEAFRDYLERHRERRFNKAIQEISRQHLAALYLSLKPWLTSLPAAGGNGRSEASASWTAEGLNERFRTELERKWNAFHERLEGTRQNHARQGIHELRIATKRLRYLTEALHQMKLHGAAAVLASLRAIQQSLGEWHDIEVTAEMLTEMAARRKFVLDHLDTASAALRLIDRQRALKKSFEQKMLKGALSEEKTGLIAGWVEDTLKSMAAKATA